MKLKTYTKITSLIYLAYLFSPVASASFIRECYISLSSSGLKEDQKVKACSGATSDSPHQCFLSAGYLGFSNDQRVTLCEQATSDAPLRCAQNTFGIGLTHDQQAKLCRKATTTDPSECYESSNQLPLSQDQRVILCAQAISPNGPILCFDEFSGSNLTFDQRAKICTQLNSANWNSSTYEVSQMGTQVKSSSDPGYRGEIYLEDALGKAEWLSYEPGVIRLNVSSLNKNIVNLNTNDLGSWKVTQGDGLILSKKGETLKIQVPAGDTALRIEFSPWYLNWMLIREFLGAILFAMLILKTYRSSMSRGIQVSPLGLNQEGLVAPY